MKVNKIIVLMTFMMLLSISSMGYYFFYSWKNNLTLEGYKSAALTSTILNNEFKAYLNGHRRPISTLAKIPDIIQALRQSNTENVNKANRVLDTFCDTLEALTCYVMDKTGMTIASSNRHDATSFVGKNYAFRPYFMGAIKEKPSTFLALGITSQKRGVYFSHHVVDEGSVLGVVVIKYSVKEIEAFFAEKNGFIAMTDEEGNVFASSREGWLYKNIHTIIQDPEAIPFAQIPHLHDLRNNTQHAVEEVGIDGSIYLSSTQKIDELKGWEIKYFYEINHLDDAISQLMHNTQTSAFLLGLVLLSLFTLLLYWIAKKDLQAQRATEIALSKAKEAAESASQAKSAFLSRMSHELRTPMNAILGFAQLLELDEDDLTKTQQENVAEILNAGHHLLNLINEVLDLSKIEAGKMQLDMASVNANEIVQQSIILIKKQSLDANITIQEHYCNQAVFVKADATRLKQVILNLLSNAVKYNSDNGTIMISTKQITPDKVSIIIRDTGLGLTEQEISQLFIPFDRLNVANHIEGTGIGLVITRYLMELMGGQLMVESEPGQGSSFILELKCV